MSKPSFFEHWSKVKEVRDLIEDNPDKFKDIQSAINADPVSQKGFISFVKASPFEAEKLMNAIAASPEAGARLPEVVKGLNKSIGAMEESRQQAEYRKVFMGLSTMNGGDIKGNLEKITGLDQPAPAVAPVVADGAAPAIPATSVDGFLNDVKESGIVDTGPKDFNPVDALKEFRDGIQASDDLQAWEKEALTGQLGIFIQDLEAIFPELKEAFGRLLKEQTNKFKTEVNKSVNLAVQGEGKVAGQVIDPNKPVALVNPENNGVVNVLGKDLAGPQADNAPSQPAGPQNAADMAAPQVPSNTLTIPDPSPSNPTDIAGGGM